MILPAYEQPRQELDRHMQHIGEAMAKAAGGAQPDGSHAHPQAEEHESHFQQQQQQQQQKHGDDDIEEAEVEIIDDKKP